jgi:hypothetical protein
VETITSLAPGDYVVAAGAAFLAYLLVPPVWSLISFTLRGYKGNGTAPVASLAFVNDAASLQLQSISRCSPCCCILLLIQVN